MPTIRSAKATKTTISRRRSRSRSPGQRSSLTWWRTLFHSAARLCRLAAVTTVSYHIQDIGNASAGASVSKVYVSTDNVITTSDSLLASVNDGTLTAGNSLSDSTSVTLPSGLAAGTYWIGVIADANNQVSESNENNNVSTPSDHRHRADAAARPGGEHCYTREHVSSGWRQHYRFLPHPKYWQCLGGTVRIKSLHLHRQCHQYVGYPARQCERWNESREGSALTDSASIMVPSGLAGGTYWIGVIADANNQISESNEGNNSSAAMQITVIAGRGAAVVTQVETQLVGSDAAHFDAFGLV